MKKLLYVLLSLVIACAVGAAACNDNRTPITISIEGAAERTLIEGETLQLEVQTNSSETVTWSSSSEANATVSAAGLVTAVAEGSAVITASAEGQSASVTVRVERDTSLEGAYSLSFEEDGAGVNLEREDAYTIRPVLKYGSDRVDGATFTFSSSDPEIAAVNETTGEVTAVSAGQATITVTYTPEEGNPVSAVFTVTVLRDLSFEISSDEEDLSLSADDEDKTVTLTATVKETTGDGEPAEIPAGEITWKSSDETVATVNENGVVTAIKHGTATITASYDIGSVSCEVSVWDKYLADTEDFLAMYSVENWTSAWFMMTDNITLPENVNYEANTIAGGVPYFTGVFDGGNKTLSGVPVRIFAGVDGGTVRNLNIEGDAGYWGGVFGDFFNSGLVENITATLTFTQTEASGTTNGYFKRANGGLFNFASGGTFRNVTVYADIPDDIDTENMVEHKTVAGMSVFGKCDATAATFENCVAYVNDMSIQFASGAQENQFVNCTGAVQGWYADYKVEHYVPNEDGTDFTLYDTEELQGLYNKTVTAEEIAIDGLVFASEYGMNVKSGVVDLEGTLVLKLYYTWNDLEIVTDMGETSEVLSAAEEQGNTWQLSAKAMRGDSPVDNATIVWTSDDDTIASVNESGLVTGLKGGKTYIRANYMGAAYAFEVTVYTRYLSSDADFGKMYADMYTLNPNPMGGYFASTAKDLTGWYLMTDNVTLTTDYEAWVIYGAGAFEGVFDGGGYTLGGLDHRLLPNMVAGGVVRNLTVENAEMDVWAGVLGELLQGGTVENVTVSVTMTNTMANGDALNWYTRAAGGLYNYVSGGTLRNVTVYMFIPEDITVSTDGSGHQWQISEMSVFGNGTAVFDNCAAYSNNASVNFALGSTEENYTNGTTGQVNSWTADYTVTHYVMNAEGEFEEYSSETLNGVVGTVVSAQPITIDGVEFSEGYEGNVTSGAILADGSLELKFYYAENIDIETDDEQEIALSMQADQTHTAQVSVSVSKDGVPVEDLTGLSWSSSDDEVATVDQEGNITAVGKGEATIYATYRGFSCPFEVTVYTRFLASDEDFQYLYVGDEYADGWYYMTASFAINDRQGHLFTKPFSGRIEGNGYTLQGVKNRLFPYTDSGVVRNLNIEATADSWGGVFGHSITGDSIFENVTLKVRMDASWALNNNSEWAAKSAGGLAIWINSGTFNNVNVYVDIPDNIGLIGYNSQTTFPIANISAFGSVENFVGAATFTNCAAYSNDTSIQFTFGADNGTVQAWSADYTVEHYIYGDSGYELHGEAQVLSGLYNKTVTAEPIAIEGYAFNEGYSGNVTSGVVTLDGALVLKLYYMPANVSMEATSATEFDLSLTSGQTGTAQAAVNAEDNSEPVVSGIAWSSSDDEIATVDDNGNITAVGHGEAVITASYRGFTCDFTVTVYDMFITSDADFGTMYEQLATSPVGTTEEPIYFDNWYKMTQDITLTTDYESSLINDYTHGFAGVFDGGNYTLRGLTHRLMVNMVDGGVIRNLTVENAVMDVWGGVLGDIMAGGLVENVTISVQMTSTRANASTNGYNARAAGGLYNYVQNGTLKNVTVYMNIAEKISIGQNTILVGDVWQTVNITVAEMSVFGNGSGSATFENCMAYSNDTRVNFAAGVQSSQLVNSTGTVQQTPSENLSLAAGQTNTAQLSVEGTEVSYISANPEIATVSETGLVTAVAHGNVFIYAVSDGQLHVFDITVYDGILSTTDDFTAMYADASYYSKWYMLANDIALASNFEQTVIYQASNFSGVFDGNGHTLSNLQSRLFQGLDGAAVKDIVIEGTVGTWGGVFGWVITGNSVLQNIQATVTLSTTWTLYTAQSMDINWSCGALTSNLQASSFMDVTVYVNIPEDINTDTYNGSPRPVTEVSAFGDMTGYTPVFTNCSAYSNDTTIQFAKGGTGTVQEWVQQ